MPTSPYIIQAYIGGLGWLEFSRTLDPKQAERLEYAACHADDKIWPGQSPRRTRILADGQPLVGRLSTLTELIA